MGFFKDAAEHLGAVDHKLLASGELARGEVVAIHPTGMSWGGGEYGSTSSTTVCKVTVNVIGLHGQAPYEASALVPIPDMYIPQFEQPGAAIAVRVNTADPHDIAYDLQHDVPDAPAGAGIATEGGAQVILQGDDGTETALTTHVGKLTAAEVLAQGKPCTVDVLAIIPIDQKNAKGEDMTGLILNVHRSGQADVQAQIGTHVPPELAGKITVGATLPARYTSGLDTGDDTVVPDWPAISA